MSTMALPHPELRADARRGPDDDTDRKTQVVDRSTQARAPPLMAVATVTALDRRRHRRASLHQAAAAAARRAAPPSTRSPARTRRPPASRTPRCGTSRRRRRRHDPGLLDRHQRERRQHRRLQDQTPPGLHDRHLPARLLRRQRCAPVAGQPGRTAQPVAQPTCLTDASTLLYDCGNWSVSATWAVPGRCGLRRLHRQADRPRNGDSSQIPFVVRNDASTSDIVYQTSDPTWQAYNTYGGSDFYTGTTSQLTGLAGARVQDQLQPARSPPAATTSGRDFLFSNEYPTIRFLERNGYDVSYIVRRRHRPVRRPLLKNHKVFMSVGHDEYWSQPQRHQRRDRPRRRRQPDVPVRQRGVLAHPVRDRASTAPTPPTAPSVDYKETWDNAPDRPVVPSRPRPGEIHASPTAPERRQPGERPDRHDVHVELRRPRRSP